MNAPSRRLVLVAGLASVAALAVSRMQSEPSAAPRSAPPRAASFAPGGPYAIGEVAFLPDRDESEPGVRYGYGRGAFSVGVTPAAAVFAQRSASDGVEAAEEPRFARFRMDVVGGSARALLRGEAPCAWRTNVYHGDDGTRWCEGLPNYARVRSRGVLPGIDAVYRAEGRRVAFDFEVAPGADPSVIAVAFSVGDDRTPRVRIDGDGSLLVASGADSMRFGAPVVYQETPHGRSPVTGSYALRGTPDGRTEVAFEVGDYDRSRALVIDPPSLGSASFLGGSGNDNVIASALGKQGELYVAGLTTAPFFATNDFLGGSSGGGYDGFVAQIASNGAVLANAVFGGSGIDYANAFTVAPVTGDVFVAGLHVPQSGPSAVAFPTTQGSYAGPGGGTATTTRGFVLRLTPALALVASATVACDKSMKFNGISVANGHVALACETSAHNLPTTAQSAHAAYPAGGFSDVSAALVLSDDLTSAQFATYVGENNGRAYDCIWKGNGNLVVVGLTTGSSLPVVSAPQAASGGGTDGWWAEYDGNLATVQVCTYVGGPGFDLLNHLAKPSSDAAFASFANDVFACGAVSQAPTLALTSGSFHGGNDILVCAIRPNAAPLVACIGGGGNELPTAMLCTGSDILTLAYTDSFGDYTLIPELGPGGGASDTCLNAFEVSGTSLVADAALNGFRWGSSAGDPSGGAMFSPVTGKAASGKLYVTLTISGIDGIALPGAAQAQNNSAGLFTDDGSVVCIEVGAPCPTPAAPTTLHVSGKVSLVLVNDLLPPEYRVQLRWDRDTSVDPPVESYELTTVLHGANPFTTVRALSLLAVTDANGGPDRLDDFLGDGETGHYTYTLVAVNSCGRSKPVTLPVEVPDPRLAGGKLDEESGDFTVRLQKFPIVGVDIPFIGTATVPDGPVGTAEIERVLSEGEATAEVFKKPAPTKTFRVSGKITVPAGSKTGSIHLDTTGLTVPIKFKLKLTLNGRSKTLKFTLKPPKPKRA